MTYTIFLYNTCGKIDPLPPKLVLDALSKRCSFFVPNAFFSPKYKDKKWDGRKRLFNRVRGAFPLGLLPEVAETLHAHGCQFVYSDTRTLNSETLAYHIKPDFVPWDHQVDAAQKGIAGQRGIISIPTGGGKSCIMAMMIASIGRKAIVLCHRRDLLIQLSESLADMLQEKIGVIGDGRCEIERVTVAMVQTVAYAHNVKVDLSDEDIFEDEGEEVAKDKYEQIRDCTAGAEIVILDEMHHLSAKTIYDVFQSIGNAVYRYGVSATAHRLDSSDMMSQAALGPVLVHYTPSQLIDAGILVEPTIICVPYTYTGEPLDKLKWGKIYQKIVVESEERNALIASYARYFMAKGMSVAISIDRIAHGERLAAMIPGSMLLFGKDETDVRRESLDALRNKDCLCLISTLISEGIDVKSLDVLIITSGLGHIVALQRLGRVLRQSPGKEKAYVVDIQDQNVPFLKDHAKARLSIWQSEPRFVIAGPECLDLG